MMFLIVVIKLLLSFPSSKTKDKHKITLALKAMMPQLSMVRKRRKGATIVINQVTTSMNVERGKLVKKRKNF
mgnify:CR=1 FL=1